MEEVATCNDLYLLASNETSTSSHLNVPRPRMTAGLGLWAHVTGQGWDEQVKGPHPRGSTATRGCQAVEVESRQSKLSCRQNHELGGHVQATWQGDHSSVTCCWVPGVFVEQRLGYRFWRKLNRPIVILLGSPGRLGLAEDL